MGNHYDYWDDVTAQHAKEFMDRHISPPPAPVEVPDIDACESVWEVEAVSEEAKGDWLQPYRSMDSSGAPEAAKVVGGLWMQEIINGEMLTDPDTLSIERSEGFNVLYRGTKMVALYSTFRDPMNFTVLMRWLSPRVQSGDGEVVKIIARHMCKAAGHDPDGGPRNGFGWINFERQAKDCAAAIAAIDGGG